MTIVWFVANIYSANKNLVTPTKFNVTHWQSESAKIAHQNLDWP